MCEDNGQDDLDLGLITPSRHVARFLTATGPDHKGSELTGVTFSPNGRRLFVSSQRYKGGGAIFEISGPFRTARREGRAPAKRYHGRRLAPVDEFGSIHPLRLHSRRRDPLRPRALVPGLRGRAGGLEAHALARGGGRARARRRRPDARGSERAPASDGPPGAHRGGHARPGGRGRALARGAAPPPCAGPTGAVRMARVLIVGCGCRGRALAEALRVTGTPCAAPRATPRGRGHRGGGRRAGGGRPGPARAR